MRWNFHVTPSRTIVCPALFPPWKRMTRSAFSAMRSVILPLPSSPHWAPTITMPAIRACSLRGPPRRTGAGLAVGKRLVLPCGRGGGRRAVRQAVRDATLVVAVQVHRLAAHLPQPRHGAVADLRAQIVVALARDEVGGQQHRPPVLVAGVDDRVELLEHPRRGLLGPDVV